MPKQITVQIRLVVPMARGVRGAHLKARVVEVDFMGMDMVLSTINHTMAFHLETVD